MQEALARERISGARLAWIGVLALLALAAFLLLADVRFNYSDPTLDGVTDAASRANMTAILIGVEAVCFLAVLLLLLIDPFGGSRIIGPDEEWTSTGGTRVGGDDALTIGCPGCGTVFEKPYTDVDEPHEQDFRCPNCGRAGHLRMELRKPVHIRATTCGNCGREFQAYREGAECPHCHAPAALS